MILVDNINILKSKYPQTWNKLKVLEDSMDKDLIKVEDTRKGDKTIVVEKDGKKTYLHSKYNPKREAETIIDEYDYVDEDSVIIFYGTGLGYHIDLLLEKYPNIDYYIYEPIPEILYGFLSNNSLKKSSSRLKNIILADDEKTINRFINRIVDREKKNLVHVNLNSHINIFEEEYIKFMEKFKEILKNKKLSIGTNLAFQERWILNSMKNFKYVLNTPNILLEKKGQFEDKPAILVAAGPSLNEEIENIRYIKENGLAYIFAVGSAVNTLIYNDIYPHAATSHDPKIGNQIAFEKIKEKGIKDIPIIFGTSVGYETLEDYPGDKYHMITSQDSVSNYYLKNKDDKDINIVQDAPSIAAVTLQLLYELGFSPIILAGQNLAYIGKAKHSEGIHYSSDLTEAEMERGPWVEDVDGNEVLTNEGFNRMRKQMEHYIKEFSDINVINTTKKGAKIEGTKFVELGKIIEKDLKERILEENWLEGNKTNYNRENLSIQNKKMNREYKKALKLIDEYYKMLKRIEKLINNRNFNQAEKAYIELDEILSKVENNEFFTVFILPMNRVHYELLVNRIDSFNEEKNPITKGNNIVKGFKSFIDSCNSCVKNIEEVYGEVVEVIDEYIENE